MCKFVIDDFILQHRKDDVRQLALQADRYPEVDMPYVLDQIAGWKKAKEKVPRWAECKDIIYPPHLNMEQCSSQTTAEYKRQLAAKILGAQRKNTHSHLTLDYYHLTPGIVEGERDEKTGELEIPEGYDAKSY